MTPYELRQMSESELEQRVEELTEEGYNLGFQKATQQTSNPSRISALRREIARIKTILREHHLGIRSLGSTMSPTTEPSEESGEEA